MKRHSISNTNISRQTLRNFPTLTPLKSSRMRSRDSRPSLNIKKNQELRVQPIQLTSRNKNLPPVNTKLLNDYLVKKQTTVISSDDGSKYMEDIKQFQELKEKPFRNNQKLVGNEAVKTFYTFYKNMDKEKKKPLNTKKQTILQILQILEKYDFPPQKMSIVRQKGQEDILYLKGYGMLSNSRKNVIEEVTQKVNNFRQAILSHNCLTNLQFLINLQQLVDLDLSNNNLSNPCIPSFKIYLTKTHSLLNLNLENNFLFDIASAQLIDELNIYQRLQKLNLSRNGCSSKTAKSLKQYLKNNKPLTQLYLHWNELDEEAGRDVFKGLEENKRLKVLDLSWNYIGGKKQHTIGMAQGIEKNLGLVHLDLSFCGLTEQDTKIISQGLNRNSTIYGFHYEGNFGFVNFKGFIVQQENQMDPLTKMKYPLPINTNYGLKRINGIRKNEQRYYFRSERSCRDICWICQSWVEKQFNIKLPQDTQNYFIYFNFQSFRAVKLSKQYDLVRMCPRGDIYFFISKDKKEFMTCSEYEVRPKDMKSVKVYFGQQIVSVELQRLNYLHVDGHHPIDDQYDPIVYSKPRKEDDRVDGKPIKKKKKPPRMQPVPYKVLQPFDFSESPFQEWKGLADDIVDKCIEFDFNNSKLEPLFQESQSVWALKLALRPLYTILCSIYYYFASNYRIKNNFYAYPVDVRNLFVELCDKRLPESFLTVIMGSVIPKIHEVQLDVDYSAKKINTTFQTINRPQFTELVYRVAYQKYTKKPKPYLLEKMQKKAQETMSSKVVMQFQDDEDGKQQKIVHVKKNRIYLPLKDAVERVIRQLEPFSNSIDSNVWRKERIWTAEIGFVLQSYQAFIKPLYMKHTHNKTRLKLKSPAMYFEDWIGMFDDAGLGNQDNKQLCRQFPLSKMVEIEQGNGLPHLQYCQFIESLVRAAELFSLKMPATDNVHPTAIPLCFKLQNLLITLYNKNEDIHNKFIKRLLQKDGLFKDQFVEFVELTDGKKDFQTQRQPFDMKMPQITLMDIIDRQRAKYERKVQEQMLLLAELAKETE